MMRCPQCCGTGFLKPLYGLYETLICETCEGVGEVELVDDEENRDD